MGFCEEEILGNRTSSSDSDSEVVLWTLSDSLPSLVRELSSSITFYLKEACIEYGLLEDNKEWDRCQFEASEVKAGYQLRNLFAMI